jgi:hypothetical protein
LAKALTNCLYQGSTGVLFDARRDAMNAFGLLPTTDGQGKLRPAAQVLRLMQQELAGATPLVTLTNTADVSGATDTPITYRPFLRDGEGIVVLWNNTGVAKDVSLEFRAEPVVSRRLAFSYGGDFATSRWQPIMQFSEEAFKRGTPSVYTRLEPLQVQVQTFRLLDPSLAWLRQVAITQPYVAPKEMPTMRSDERTWWTDMLKHPKPMNSDSLQKGLGNILGQP